MRILSKSIPVEVYKAIRGGGQPKTSQVSPEVLYGTMDRTCEIR